MAQPQKPAPILLFEGFPSNGLLVMLTQVQLANGMIVEDDGTLGDLQHRNQIDFRGKIVGTILTAMAALVKEVAPKGLDFLLLSEKGTFIAEFVAQLTGALETVTGKLPDENKNKILERLYQELCSVGALRDEEVVFRYDGQLMVRACHNPPLPLYFSTFND